MNKITIYFSLLLCILIIAACSSSKKSASTVSTAPAKTPTPNSSSNSMLFVKPTGINAPGDAELIAIQTQYIDCTMAQLNKGHEIYTMGACVNCHGAMNIYERTVEQWKPIIDDMARKANITDVEKDAVYKYVLAIKATQPKK